MKSRRERERSSGSGRERGRDYPGSGGEGRRHGIPSLLDRLERVSYDRGDGSRRVYDAAAGGGRRREWTGDRGRRGRHRERSRGDEPSSKKPRMGWEEWDASARSRGGLAGGAGSSGRAEMDLRLRRKQVEELQQKELAKIMERRDEKSRRDLDLPLSKEEALARTRAAEAELEEALMEERRRRRKLEEAQRRKRKKKGRHSSSSSESSGDESESESSESQEEEEESESEEEGGGESESSSESGGSEEESESEEEESKKRSRRKRRGHRSQKKKRKSRRREKKKRKRRKEHGGDGGGKKSEEGGEKEEGKGEEEEEEEEEESGPDGSEEEEGREGKSGSEESDEEEEGEEEEAEEGGRKKEEEGERKEEEKAAKTPPPPETTTAPPPPAPKRSPSPPKLPNYFPAIQGCRSVEEFTCLNRIEEGTYGVVFRAKDKKTEEIVALKRLKMEKEKEGFPITSLREINTLLKAQHKNIVTVREIVVGSNMDRIFIVMDYVEHDLKSLMETLKRGGQVFLQAEVKTILRQLLSAVAHLHDNWILHRDLKTSNLLLSVAPQDFQPLKPDRALMPRGEFGMCG
ncbi:unnamed protein product [Cyprideis torosa]|uniref:cyclin-dependent kinase n=1 Tax=Cyprideis torosa TaxID=163714 RepID=A0A7R8WNC6_9CRUS|nr:unnamed protein product [Cyprideis torosa]CAG0899438.1 unnamed protein product [Cyprideis torosa]